MKAKVFYKSKKIYRCSLVYDKAYSASKYFESADVTDCYKHMLEWDKIDLEDYLNLLKLSANENNN